MILSITLFVMFNAPVLLLLMTGSGNSENLFKDTATYVVIIIALFSSYYGTWYVDASEKRLGIVSAVALESFLKILFFTILGLYVVFGVFHGFAIFMIN